MPTFSQLLSMFNAPRDAGEATFRWIIVTLSEHSSKGTWEKCYQRSNANLYSKSLTLRCWSPPDASGYLQRGRCPLLLETLDAACLHSPGWYLSPPSGPSSPVSLPLLPLLLLRHPVYWSQPRHATITWENISLSWEDIPEWERVGKRGQRLQKVPPSNADLFSGLRWELLLCQTEPTTYHSLCFPCLHLWYTSSPLLRSTAVKIQPTKCTSVLYQSNLAVSSKLRMT